MPDIIVGFAGHARSGKTSIAELVSAITGIPVVRFSREVERIARARGLPLEPPETRRETLMAVGESLVSADPEAFCRQVLGQAAWMPGRSLIIEGVRHRVVAEILGRLVAPTEFRLVLVFASPDVREKRLFDEGLPLVEARAHLDEHSTEREVESELPALASLVVDGSGDPKKPATAVVEAMRGWGWQPTGAEPIGSTP